MERSLNIPYIQLESDVSRGLETLISEAYDINLTPEDLCYYSLRAMKHVGPVLNEVLYAGLVIMVTEIALKDVINHYNLE